MNGLKVGSCFSSYEEFDAALQEYCEKNCVCFYKREARTISAASRKTERIIKPELKYYQLKYACVEGGKAFISHAKGKRSTGTFKHGCNANVRVRASKCGSKLEVIHLSEEHNHELTQKRRKIRETPTEISDPTSPELEIKAEPEDFYYSDVQKIEESVTSNDQSYDEMNYSYSAFGIFVGEEIRNIKSEALRNKLKKNIIRLILDASDKDEQES